MTMKIESIIQSEVFHSAVKYALEAGQLVKDHIGNLGRVERKVNHSDLVTEIDKRSEALLRNKIQEEYPSHWIFSEETNGSEIGQSVIENPKEGFGWVIDPIDGTTNFIHGIPYFAISIGILKDGKPYIGVIYNPMTEELFTAMDGVGAFLNGEKITVGGETELSESMVVTGFPAHDFRSGSKVLQQMDRVAGKVRSIRIFGAASLDLCMVAMGRLSGFYHEGLHPWDTAAGILMVREAGGKVTDKDGQDFELSYDSLLATNGRIHEDLLKELKL